MASNNGRGNDKFESREEDIGASDYRAFFDSSVLRVWHLDGKERVFRISEVRRLTAEIGVGGKREVKRQPLLRLQNNKGQDVPLPLALNKTNAKTIAGLYGNDPRKWVGRLVALYPTTTEVGGRTEDCIRIRNEDPAKRARKTRAADKAATGAAAAPEREPGDDQEDIEPAHAPPSDPLDHERAGGNDLGSSDLGYGIDGEAE